ncbi:unnamed protein product [Rotaria sp. Silwood2]|nr:unnamed protein product [Rotaria sp. Silwood2]CAF3076802.1 unnamed protein product [Rotaria sp. Silwood2]CAF3399160.1 unnamed protein product [Rotaria sp. Silwood2]CAF4331483.1 unnamed protein product [Rotaria sp. Silwood2]CAF4410474.1 unnamed protein product [Rotaria sp. Silwood2]
MATDILSSESHRADNNKTENLVLIWIDPSANSDENLNAQQNLTSIYKNVKAFTSVVDGENAIQQWTRTNEVILIVSGEFGRELVPRIHRLEQLLTIYIFCIERENHIQWAKEYSKIKALVIKLDRFVSIIESDHEQRINKKAEELIAVPNPSLNSGLLIK